MQIMPKSYRMARKADPKHARLEFERIVLYDRR